MTDHVIANRMRMAKEILSNAAIDAARMRRMDIEVAALVDFINAHAAPLQAWEMVKTVERLRVAAVVAMRTKP